MDRCLLDFEEKGEDDFSNLRWESPKVKMIDFEIEGDDQIFEFKRIFTAKRIPKKKGLEFAIISETIHEDNERSWDDIMTFKKEDDARDWLEGHKVEMEWFEKKNKEGKVFDGRRYMWEVKDGKITGKRGWD